VTKALNPEADAAAPIVTIATDTVLGPAGTRALAAAILARGNGFKPPAYKHVKALRLWRAGARDSGAAAMGEVLRNGGREGVALEMLELMQSGVGPPGAGALGAALTLGANASLTTLRLDMNPDMGDEGVAALARGLRTNRTLKVLTLSYCGVTPAGAASLATVLTAPLPVLEAVDVTGNPLTSIGVGTLAGAAKASRTLKELVLADTQVGGGFLLPRDPGAPASVAEEAAAAGGDAAAAVADALAHSAEATRVALTALGEALSSPDCGLARVDLQMNALTADDGAVLLPFLAPENKKVEMFKVDTTLPPAIFVALIRIPAPAKKGKKKK
jgi:hypothetical protein